VTTAATELDPSSHFAVMRTLEAAFTRAAGTGGVAAFRVGEPDDAGRVDWYIDLANGGVHHLQCVGGSGNGGGGTIGRNADSIVYGPAPVLVPIPEVPVDGGRIRTADVEAWAAAVITHAAPVTDGQSWLQGVERYSLRPEERRQGHRFGITARTHAGGGVYVYWTHATARGQQPRGAAYSAVPDAV